MAEKIPKDLGVKVGTKEEVFWREVITKFELQLDGLDKEFMFVNGVLEMARTKAEEEKKKFLAG